MSIAKCKVCQTNEHVSILISQYNKRCAVCKKCGNTDSKWRYDYRRAVISWYYHNKQIKQNKEVL